MLFEDNLKEMSYEQLREKGLGHLEIFKIVNDEPKLRDVHEQCIKVFVCNKTTQKPHSDKLWKKNEIYLKNGALSVIILKESGKLFDIYNISLDTATLSLSGNSFKEMFASILWEMDLVLDNIVITPRGKYWLSIEEKDTVLDDEFISRYDFTNKTPNSTDILSAQELDESLTEHDNFDCYNSKKTIIERFEEFKSKIRLTS